MNTQLETLIDQLIEAAYNKGANENDIDTETIWHTAMESVKAQILRQADQQTQPADQKTHSVEDSPEYKAGLAAGKASYARHYKCGCTAFPADAPAYCPIHSASQKGQGK